MIPPLTRLSPNLYVYDSFTVEKPIDVTEQYTDVETGAWYVPAINMW